MDPKNTDVFKTSCILSVPIEYVYSIFALRGNEDLVFSMVSNSIVINEATSLKIGLSIRSHKVLTPLKFKFYDDETDLQKYNIIKRLVHVVVDESVDKDTIVFSEELLFNLQSSSHQCFMTNIMKTLYLTVSAEASHELSSIPSATKVVISPFSSELPVEASFIDELLQKHFMFKKYLCKNDIFGIAVEKHHSCIINNRVRTSYVYFKVIDLESAKTSPGASVSSFVDSSVTMYQATSYQGFLPRRNVHLSCKPSLYYLMSDRNFLQNIITHNHYIVPFSFNEIFNVLCNCLKPFLSTSKIIQDLGLSPIFLLTGANGSGKSMLLKAASQFLGVRYLRVDCVTVGGTPPGQGEAKLKTIFNQMTSIAPCLLHLSNIEMLCKDADNKEDVRVMSCFEQQVKMLKLKWPVVIVATSHNVKSVSSNLKHLFLDEITLSTPNCEQRESIISWLYHCNSESLDSDVIQTVASQTSGFGFRDLQVLVGLAFKERFKRYNEETKEYGDFVLADFTRTIATMHKAYSESIGAPKVPSVLWKDVGGLEHLKKEILRSLRSNMFDSGLRRSGLLLHGPPGTGKTLLAKAVATQCGRNFLSVKGPELLNMYVGQSEHNVRDLFELAKAATPCIIFFDELDSLAPNRGRSGDSGGVMDRVVSQLLAEMDSLGLGDSGDIFILGATNRPDLIDPALLRPGRLDKLLYVGPCEDRNSQLGVISALTHKLSLDGDVDLQEIVNLLPPSVTGAQLSAICSAAWLSSARHIINSGEGQTKTTVIVNRAHFLSALGAGF